MEEHLLKEQVDEDLLTSMDEDDDNGMVNAALVGNAAPRERERENSRGAGRRGGAGGTGRR